MCHSNMPKRRTLCGCFKNGILCLQGWLDWSILSNPSNYYDDNNQNVDCNNNDNSYHNLTMYRNNMSEWRHVCGGSQYGLLCMYCRLVWSILSNPADYYNNCSDNLNYDYYNSYYYHNSKCLCRSKLSKWWSLCGYIKDSILRLYSWLEWPVLSNRYDTIEHRYNYNYNNNYHYNYNFTLYWS